MTQAIKVVEKPIQARLTIPGSKSITNRALLLAALADGVSELFEILISDDTLAFIHALHQLGIMIQLDEEARSCIVGGGSGTFPKKEAKIWCESAGTVERFLLAACASSPGNYFFDGTEQLRHRPIEPLMRVLGFQGATFTPRHAKEMPFIIEGTEGLAGGQIDIEDEQSSQFISALLMIAPFAKNAMTILTQNPVSRPFIDMTIAMMGEFGVLVRRMHQTRLHVPRPQRYSARDYHVEPDLSTASYFFAAAALTAGQLTIQPLDTKTSKQGDVKFISILEKMGCRFVENQTGLTIKGPTELRGISIDMSDCSDTFMTLAAIAPFAKTPTTITNIGHTRFQESNRISVMREQLTKLNIQAEEGPDWIKIFPGIPTGNIVDPHHDHRIAMSFSILGLKVPGIKIKDAECVGKTCPKFFDLLNLLY